jgi:molecular chaperone DnaK
MTRAKLEELAGEFVDRAMMISKRAMEASPFSVSDINEVVLVGGQTRMPMIQKAVKDFFGKEPHLGVNPDEVVAIGAAIQGGILAGDVKDVLLLDVIPLSLGIETMGNVATKLIEKNTTIPTSRSQAFSTAADNQTSVEIHIVQGERAMANDNKSLGRFILDGIPPAPRGMPQVEVTFDIDSNGILNVKAKDKTSGKEQSIRIEARSGLSEEEIERMKKDAEAHADQDKRSRDLAEARNIADSLVYTAEKSLTDHGAKMPEDAKKAVNDAIAKVKTETGTGDIEGIKSATQALSTEMQKIAEYVKEKPEESKGGEAPQEGSNEKKDGDETIRDV